jgi:hypothetical protein
MGSVIGSLDCDANLPEASHTEIDLRLEAPFPIGLNAHSIGTHVHIEHRGVEYDVHMSRPPSGTGIAHMHNEEAGTAANRVDVERYVELFICRSHIGMKCCER